MAIKKNIVQDVLAEAKQIEKFAYESAKKALEESLAPQIEEAVKNSLKELEENTENEIEIAEETNEVVEEGVSIEISKDGESLLKIDVDDNNEIETSTDTNSTETINSEPEMTNMNHEEDEIFEIDGLGSEPAPAVEPAGAEAIAEPEPSLLAIDDTLKDLSAKVDSILAAINPDAGTGSEGEVEVVDDEMSTDPAAAATAATGAAPAPAPANDEEVVSEDDIMFEIDEDFLNGLSEDVVSEESIDEEVSLAELSETDEIEIVDEGPEDTEDEDENVEEMRGVGNTVKRSAGNRQNFTKDLKHAPVGVSEGTKIKAHNESKTDELIKENASLKEAVKTYKENIKEFESSFVNLQKQINSMQVFNGKLAWANKLLYNGGFTVDEKMKIAEAFDKAESIEDAKKLYNKLISEMSISKSNGSTGQKVKTEKPMVASSTKESQVVTIFETEERKRMKKLAGLINEGN